jgi:hypothetical protein
MGNATVVFRAINRPCVLQEVVTITTQPERLGRLAQRINREHRQVQAAFGKTLQHAKRAGELLVQAKERTPFGQWGPWLETNFEGSERTAQNYMRVHPRWAEIEAKTKSVADLSLTGALKALSPPQEATITRDQATAITREPVAGPLPGAGVETGEEPTEPREQGKGERSEDKDDYDYAQSLMAKAPEGGDEIAEVIRAEVIRVVDPQYLVRRADGNPLRVTRKRLLEAGWRKCSSCNGYGIWR